MELSKLFALCVRIPLSVLLVVIAAEFFASSKTVTIRSYSYSDLRPTELTSRNIDAGLHSPGVPVGHTAHHEVMKEPSFRLVAPPSHHETGAESASSPHHQNQDFNPGHVSEHGNHMASHYEGHAEGHHVENHDDNHHGSYYGDVGHHGDTGHHADGDTGHHEVVHLLLENHPGGHHENLHDGAHHEIHHHKGQHESHHHGWGWQPHGGHKEGDTLDKFWNLLGPIIFPLSLFVSSLPFALPVIPFAFFTRLNATDEFGEG